VTKRGGRGGDMEVDSKSGRKERERLRIDPSGKGALRLIIEKIKDIYHPGRKGEGGGLTERR